jgi:DNA-binding ferritin-like protein
MSGLDEILDGHALWEEHKPQTGEDWLAVAERFIAAGETTERSSPLFAALVLAIQRDATSTQPSSDSARLSALQESLEREIEELRKLIAVNEEEAAGATPEYRARVGAQNAIRHRCARRLQQLLADSKEEK